MSDPSIEAARWAWDAIPERSYKTRTDVMEAAAREALKPIRELHKPFRCLCKRPGCSHPLLCEHCTEPGYLEGMHWPCDTALLVYTTEELERLIAGVCKI